MTHVSQTGRTGLQRRAERVLRALISTPTVGAAAKVAGVSRRTVSRYMAKPDFQARLEAARLQAEERELQLYGDLLRQRLAAARAALAEAERLLQDPETPPQVKAALASKLLDSSDGVADRLAPRWASRSRAEEVRRGQIAVRWDDKIEEKFEVVDAKVERLDEKALVERAST